MNSQSTSSLIERIYRPSDRHDTGFFQTWLVMARNVIGARELIWQLFKRDFFASYKKSFLGLTWIFLSPLVGILSWLFLQATGMLNPGNLGVPYPVYVLVGTSMWQLFLGFFSAATSTLSAGQSLVMQVQYPHEALLFQQTAQHLANFLIGFLMNVIVLLWFGITISWHILLLPLVVLPLFFLGAGIGLISSMISIVAVDVGRVIQMGMSLLIWSIPIIYSDKVSSPFVKAVIAWNPLTYLVCSARDLVLRGQLYDPFRFAICSLLSLLIFLVSWRLFYVSEDRVIERMI